MIVCVVVRKTTSTEPETTAGMRLAEVRLTNSTSGTSRKAATAQQKSASNPTIRPETGSGKEKPGVVPETPQTSFPRERTVSTRLRGCASTAYETVTTVNATASA